MSSVSAEALPWWPVKDGLEDVQLESSCRRARQKLADLPRRGRRVQRCYRDKSQKLCQLMGEEGG